jgi:hypothetical protein
MNRLPPVTSSSTILVTVTSPIRHFIIAFLQLSRRKNRQLGGSGSSLLKHAG